DVGRPDPLQAMEGGVHSMIVESKSILHALGLCMAEHPRPRIPRLRLWRDRAHLREAEAEGGEGAHGAGVLVEAGGEARGIGEGAAEEGLAKGRRVDQVAAAEGGGERWQGLERPERGHAGTVGGLRVEAEEQAAEGRIAGHGRGILSLAWPRLSRS